MSWERRSRAHRFRWRLCGLLNRHVAWSDLCMCQRSFLSNRTRLCCLRQRMAWMFLPGSALGNNHSHWRFTPTCEVHRESGSYSMQVLNSSQLEKELIFFLLGCLSLEWTFKTEVADKPTHCWVYTSPANVESSRFVSRQTALDSHSPWTAYKLFDSQYVSLGFSLFTVKWTHNNICRIGLSEALNEMMYITPQYSPKHIVRL